MPTSPSRHAEGAEQRSVFGCVSDSRARARVQTALRGHAAVRWFTSFNEIRHALEHGERPATAVIGLSDGAGGTAAGFARDVREDMTGTSIVVCCDLAPDNPAPIAMLGEAG